MGKIKVGAFIIIKDLGKCKILELDSNIIIVEDKEGMEHEIPNSSL